MKQLLVLIAVIAITSTCFSQGGQKWAASGNSTSSGDFLGTTNNQPLVLKTNNTTRGTFTSTGNFQLVNLQGTGNRLLQTDANGNIIPFAMGNANEVLYGNGTWGVLPNMPTLFWQQHGTDLYYMDGKVGIGTNTPLVSLDVIGDARISNNLYVGGGIIITEKVNANAEVLTGSLKADSIKMDSTKAVYGYSIFKDKVKLENKLQVDGDVLVNGSLTSNTINTNNFNISNTLAANKITAYRITSQPGDSLIRFGDSTIYFDGTWNRIYGGAPYGLALGLSTKALALASLAIGTTVYVANSAIRAIAIGSGGLVNNVPNSLFVGFNSTIPTLVVTPAPSSGQTGNVSIGGNTAPTYKLQVESGNTSTLLLKTTLSNGYALKAEVTDDQNKSIVVEKNGTENFKVYGSGRVYAREVNVQLGTFPDYVFDKTYSLMNINDVASFIKENKHLPNIPSASEVQANGIGIGELQLKLLEKVEELHLYLIDQNKKIEQLEQQNATLKNQIEELKK